MFRITLAGLLTHKLRLALTAIAIVLGVSLVSGTFVLGDTLNDTFDRIFADANAGVSATVSGLKLPGANRPDQPQRDTVPASVLDQVRGVQGVRTAAGEVRGVGAILGRDGKPLGGQAPHFGISWIDDQQLSPYHLREGRAPHGDHEVVLDVVSARKQNFHLGDTVQIVPADGMAQPFTVVGLTGFGSQDNLAGATVAAWDVATAQRLLNLPDRFSSIVIAGDGSVDNRTLADRLTAALPKTVEAQTKEDAQAAQAAQIKTGLQFVSYFLLAFGVIALFVGSFIIVNTFSILVAQRSRELALLRCLGATRRQVRTSVLTEAALIGLLASAVGTALGLLIAKGLFALFNSAGSSLPNDRTVVLPRTIVVSMLLGVGVTLMAAFFPARRATRIAPIAALREADPGLQAVGRTRAVFGLLITGGGLLLLLLGLFGSTSNRLQETLGGAFFIFLGMGVVAPLLVRPVAGVLGAPLARMRGVTGKLARENSVRSPRRTASSSAALMIGLGLVTFFAVFGASAKGTVSSALDKGDRAAYLVSNDQGTINPSAAERLRKDAKLADVTEIRIGPFSINDNQHEVQAIDTAHLDRVVGFDIISGAVDLSGDSVLISDTTANDTGYSVGSTVPMSFPYSHRTINHQVRGVYKANGILGGYTISLDGFSANYPPAQQQDVVILVNPAAGVDAAAGLAAMTADLSSFPTLNAQDQSTYKQSQANQLDTFLNIINALLALAIIIAVLGIVNTLTLSIVERYREIGLLRALGLTRWQSRWMIVLEAVITALLGAALGLVIGVFLGWALVRALKDQGFDTFVVPWGSLVAYVIAAALFGVLAAIIPAIRAGRLKVLAAIASE